MQIERGQWGVIDAARTRCQVIGGNIVELGNPMTAGLASYNTAVTNIASVNDPPRKPNANDTNANDTAE
jgi:hypothetical protein